MQRTLQTCCSVHVIGWGEKTSAGLFVLAFGDRETGLWLNGDGGAAGRQGSVQMTRQPGLICIGVCLALFGCKDGEDSNSGDGGVSDSSQADGTDTNETAPPPSGSTAGEASAEGDDTSAEGGSEGQGEGNAIYDVLAIPDTPALPCDQNGKGRGGGGSEPEFSFLWAANSTQGTISKIDTETVLEVGRFQTRPDTGGSPSRTSVSLSGHVAVANRNGGIAKFYAMEEFCQESNGSAGIQTSTDAVALAWDEEECRAWYTEFSYSSQRPIAWTPGEWNPSLCARTDEMVWTAGRQGTGADEVILIDGETGVVADMVDVPGLKSDPYGLYGGAVDSEGNFWATGWASGNQLVRVDIHTMEATVYDGPTQATGMDSHWYGMTVDVNGYVWNCASRVARFDPDDEEWTVSNELGVWAAGCMADAEPDGLLWIGTSGSGITGINREDFSIEATWSTPTSYGVSVDYEGYIWAVNGNGAHRVDPENGDVVSYNGLIGAYTYSDMTGGALNAVGGIGPSG